VDLVVFLPKTQGIFLPLPKSNLLTLYCNKRYPSLKYDLAKTTQNETMDVSAPNIFGGTSHFITQAFSSEKEFPASSASILARHNCRNRTGFYYASQQNLLPAERNRMAL